MPFGSFGRRFFGSPPVGNANPGGNLVPGGTTPLRGFLPLGNTTPGGKTKFRANLNPRGRLPPSFNVNVGELNDGNTMSAGSFNPKK